MCRLQSFAILGLRRRTGKHVSLHSYSSCIIIVICYQFELNGTREPFQNKLLSALHWFDILNINNNGDRRILPGSSVKGALNYGNLESTERCTRWLRWKIGVSMCVGKVLNTFVCQFDDVQLPEECWLQLLRRNGSGFRLNWNGSRHCVKPRTRRP